MKIPIEHLKAIQLLDEDRVCIIPQDPHFSVIYKTNDSPSIFGYHFKIEHMGIFDEKQIPNANFLISNSVKDRLEKTFPDVYTKTVLKKPLVELIAQAEEYLFLNKRSEKKRVIRVLNDICSPMQTNQNLQQIVVPYGEQITNKSIPWLKRIPDQMMEVGYKDSEGGVLLFVPDAENMKLRIDLIAILGLFDLELYNAEDVEDAFRLYVEKRPKLVILGMLGTNLKSKELFIFLQEYDPFVKKMDYAESPSSYRNEEVKRIEKNYFSGYKGLINSYDEEKDTLPEELRKEIMKSIYQLQNQFQRDAFIEKSFAIKQFARSFNVQVLWKHMQNIRQANKQVFPVLKYM